MSRVLASGSGRSVRTLWLDEPLAPADEPTRAAFVETLAGVMDDFDLVVVVSHAEDVRDAFERVLEVRQGPDGVSSATLV